jgi:DNA polymerase epsilon subunit 1
LYFTYWASKQNLPADVALFVADIDFARRLHKQDMIMWWSEEPHPDLGGHEQDSKGGEELVVPRTSMPGCYSNAVLEINMVDLAINSILQSAIVNEMEGSGTGSMAFDSASHNLDEYAKGSAHTAAMLGDAVLPTQTFSVLKSMVRSWWTDHARARAKSRIIRAPELVVNHFWRWLSSSSAAMYDPALQRFLHGLMRKVYLQLLSEFKRLGAQVVYADFGRLFLLTSKPDAGSAFAFAQYLVTAANSQPLFQDISFQITQFWNYLAWMDIANFGGVKVAADVASTSKASDECTITMDWNIQAYLPPGIQHYFETQVGNFIWAMYSAKQKSSDGRTPLKMIHDLNMPVNGGVAPPTQLSKAKVKELVAAQSSVSQQLTRKLLSVVAKIRKRQAAAATDPDEAELLAFPLLPGGVAIPTNPSLEFVKTICAVFSLASELKVEVQILKRNLLDLCNIREFSEEAAFRNPCQPLILPMVICDHCFSHRDVDLCRDPDRLPIVDPASRGKTILPPRRSSWACTVSLGALIGHPHRH